MAAPAALVKHNQLQLAARQNDLVGVLAALENGAPANLPASAGKVEHGSGPRTGHSSSNDPDTPLTNACHLGNLEMATMLLLHGASTEQAGMYQLAPIMYAAEAGHAEVVRLLLDRGVDANQPNVVVAYGSRYRQTALVGVPHKRPLPLPARPCILPC